MCKAYSSTWRAVVLSLLLILAAPVVVTAATLVLDGQFDDWAGQPHVDDPAGDGQNPHADVLAFYWGTNPDEEYVYWMMQRVSPPSGKSEVYYFCFLDTNNDGDYGDPADRMVRARYDPGTNDSEVVVTVLSGDGGEISQSSGDWGESIGEGAGRAEWRASFADLGIDVHQTITSFAGAAKQVKPDSVDRVPDEGDITWSPIPVLGWPWLIAILIGVTGLAWRTWRRNKWRRSSPLA